MEPLKKFKIALTLITLLLLIGVLGYMMIEKFSLIESLYMTVITISTVGFHEVKELSTSGRIFTIFLIFCSISILAFGINIINSFIIEGRFGYIARRRRMEDAIKSLREHYIVCGNSKVSQQAVAEFLNAGVNFVLVASNKSNLEKLIEGGRVLFLERDPRDDENLKIAGIERAKGLLACMEEDVDNLFIVISSRSLNPRLKIVALVREETSQSKMLKAGADNVISPEIIGGRRMAYMLLKPEVLSFLDVMTRTTEDISLRLEEIKIPENSPLKGLSLAQAKIPQKTGLLIVAIKRPQGEFVYNPHSQTLLKEGEVLIVLGNDEQIKKLKEYIAS